MKLFLFLFYFFIIFCLTIINGFDINKIMAKTNLNQDDPTCLVEVTFSPLPSSLNSCPSESYNVGRRGIQFNDDFPYAEDCNFLGYCEECPRWDEEGCKNIGEEEEIIC